MKRALWITVIATALLVLAAAGLVARSVHRPSSEPISRRRRERLVRRHELDRERREARRRQARSGSVLRAAYAR